MAQPFTPLHYPSASPAGLKLQYIGKTLQEVETPAVVIDQGIAKRNCQAMLDITDKLGLGLRVHVKSHKVSKQPETVPFQPITTHPNTNQITTKVYL